MSRNEDFDNGFWSQRAIEDLSPQATLLYIWSWTNPHCGMAGLYEVGPRAMSESKVTVTEMPAALAELERGHLAVYREDVMWVIARVKRLRTKSIQIAKAIAKDVAAVRDDHPLRLQWLEHHREASWLHTALSERHVSLTGASGEPHETVVLERDRVSLTRTSPEVPLSGEGKGPITNDLGDSQITRELVDEAVAILAARWPGFETVALENAAAMYPTVDLLQAARLAVTWASDASWEMKSGPATLRAALRRLDAEKPKADENAERRTRRGAALQSLMARTGPA